MLQLPAALQPLGAYNQFIVYIIVPKSDRPGKTDKLPVDHRTGFVTPKDSGGAHNPAIWTDFATAANVAAQLGANHGVGFVFTVGDPFWFLDIDSCLETDDEGNLQWSKFSRELLATFPGAAIEVSSSGKGLHVFGTGTVPPHKTRGPGGTGIEFYTEGRFVALTGNQTSGSAATDCSATLPYFVEQLFPPGPTQTYDLGWTVEPCPEWNGPTDDDDLIRRALNSHSATAVFGRRASFAQLWDCDEQALSIAYPDIAGEQGRSFGASEADAALVQHLAFWTGKDCERMKRLMFRSSLYRDKWERDDYIDRTIIKAVSQQREVLYDNPPEPVDSVPVAEGEAPKPSNVTGSTYLSAEHQIQLFAGCVYVRDAHRVLVPGGVLLKPEQFRTIFGGYTFSMDAGNERTTRNAWEAFTESQCYRAPKADGTVFKPALAPGTLVTDSAGTRVNTWWPVTVPIKEGDVGPFLRHLEKVLPNERDRRILVSYMRACVQHIGIKFQWAPLLQGVPGNGKTLFSRCVAEAVGRRYVHWPKASRITGQFNGWMIGNVLICVEDVYVPEHKHEVIEELKPMITGGDGLEIERKGIDQISADVCCNFMLNCNKKEGLRKTRDDRRFSVFYTAQQTPEDLARDGMTGGYFPKLYHWLMKEDGYAIVTNWLKNQPIDPEFNPAGACQVAPITSTTDAAITAGLGSIEQEVLEAIGQGLPGFAGGWVSSMALDRLLEHQGSSRRISLNKRREMLLSLGYDVHPGLPDGRVNNTILPDGGKPKLYIRLDHPLRSLTVGAEIAKAYSAAQIN